MTVANPRVTLVISREISIYGYDPISQRVSLLAAQNYSGLSP